MSFLSLVLLAAQAFAGAPNAEQRVGAARLYGTGRASLAVPSGYAGFATGYSAELGASFRDGNQLGVRFVLLPDPPDVYGDDTPAYALGPVVTWAYNVRVAPQFDIGPTVGLGAAFGQSPVDGENQVLPYLQGGLVLRGRIALPNEGALIIGPEVGFVPTVLAPYAALSIGILGPPPAPVSPS